MTLLNIKDVDLRGMYPQLALAETRPGRVAPANAEKKGDLDRSLKVMRRGLHRVHTGASVDEPYLLVTLTAPGGVDLHKAWRKLLWRLRYRKIKLAYYAVKETGTRTGHPHLHVVFRVDWLDAEFIRRQWTAACGNPVDNCWTHHDFVSDRHGIGKYLAKYLLKAALDGVKRGYWYSADWVFRKWVAFTKAMWHVGSPVERTRLLAIRANAVPSALLAHLAFAVTRANTGGFYLGRLSKTGIRLLRGFGLDLSEVKNAI